MSDPSARIGASASTASGEFGLIARHFTRPDRASRALLGVGDDCALLVPARGALAVSTDMLLEGRHFFADADPESLGHKALAVNLSDLAAMGAAPIAFTLAVALPRLDDAWLSSFARGLFALADQHQCELVGGDTTRGPLNLCITVMGEVSPAQALRRDGARTGDDLWVSGSLGGAAWSVAHRQRSGGWARPAEVRADAFECALSALHRPQPRIALGLALRGLASAAIDLSDGLAGDLRHILERSSQACGESLTARIDLAHLPLHPVLHGMTCESQWRHALAGGDDYELLFTAAPEYRQDLATIGERLGLPLTRIGIIEPAQPEPARPEPAQPESTGPDEVAVESATVRTTSGPGEAARLRLIDAQGHPVMLSLQAHDHFLSGMDS